MRGSFTHQHGLRTLSHNLLSYRGKTMGAMPISVVLRLLPLVALRQRLLLCCDRAAGVSVEVLAVHDHGGVHCASLPLSILLILDMLHAELC